MQHEDSLASDMEPGKNRNSRRGFDALYLNVRLSKYFTIDRFRFQIFGEMYNISNKANFGDIYNIIDQTAFGNPLGAGDPRRVQFGARFDF